MIEQWEVPQLLATGVKLYSFSPAWMNAFTFSISLHLTHHHIGAHILPPPFDAQTPLFTCFRLNEWKAAATSCSSGSQGVRRLVAGRTAASGLDWQKTTTTTTTGLDSLTWPTIHSLTTAKPFFNYSQGCEAKLDCSGQFVGLRRNPSVSLQV